MLVVDYDEVSKASADPNSLNGKIVVLELHGEMFCRRYLTRDSCHYFVAENPDVKNTALKDFSPLKIHGVVVATVREEF